MIPQREFYFVRHGQTDHNISPLNLVVDHPSDIPLNATGRAQAVNIEPIIASLPVKTICCSPFRRAQETKELIVPRLSAPLLDIEELGECTTSIWKKMYARKDGPSSDDEDQAVHFMERVKRGLQRALSQEAPVLIIAHGGVHLAICALLEVAEYEWVIDNCGIAHFSVGEAGLWTAKRIF